MSLYDHFTTKTEITDYVNNQIKQCLFYESKNRYMMERIKMIEKNNSNIEDYKNKIKEFINFYNIENIIKNNNWNQENLDSEKIKNLIQDYKNKVNESNLMDSTKESLNKKLSDYLNRILTKSITIDDLYESVHNLMESYSLI